MLVFNQSMSDYLQADEFISASDLKTLITKSPFHFQKRKDLVRESEAMTFGTLCHTAILEADKLAEYVIEPPLDKRTKAWKEWLAQNEGKPSISQADAERVELIRERLRQVGILPIFDRGVSEVSAYSAAENGLKIRGRADKFDSKNKIIVDLKTTRDLQWFAKDIFRYGYDLSVPHYQTVFGNASSISPYNLTYLFVAVESVPPYDCGWYQLGRESLDKAQAKWESAVIQCKEVIENKITQGFTMPTPQEV
jgi:exodeoxyribonuclease VIII